jgi:hypothetical protein
MLWGFRILYQIEDRRLVDRSSKGIYEIELQNAQGYVYKSLDIRHALSDESLDDVAKKQVNINMKNYSKEEAEESGI